MVLFNRPVFCSYRGFCTGNRLAEERKTRKEDRTASQKCARILGMVGKVTGAQNHRSEKRDTKETVISTSVIISEIIKQGSGFFFLFFRSFAKRQYLLTNKPFHTVSRFPSSAKQLSILLQITSLILKKTYKNPLCMPS